MYRNYYSFNDMPSVATKAEPKPEPCKASPPPAPPQEKPQQTGFLQSMSADDLILLAVIFLLLANGCNDRLLLAVIGFVFLTGILF